MKKKLFIFLFLALISNNIFSFQIGSSAGLALGSSSMDYDNIKEPVKNFYCSGNFFLMFPRQFKINSNFGRTIEMGLIDQQPIINYLLNYSWKINKLNISPFAGFGFLISMGVSIHTGCSIKYPVWIGDLYCDLRFGTNFSLTGFETTGGSVNIGYIFKFGKDRL